MMKERITLERIVLTGIMGSCFGAVAGVSDESQDRDIGILLGAVMTTMNPLTPLTLIMGNENFKKSINMALLGTPTFVASYYTSYFLSRAVYSAMNL